jgi:hypothetical protein
MLCEEMDVADGPRTQTFPVSLYDCPFKKTNGRVYNGIYQSFVPFLICQVVCLDLKPNPSKLPESSILFGS